MIATVVDQEDLTTYSASLYSYLTSLRWSFFRERLQEDFPSLLYCGLWWSGKHTSQILCTASVVFLVCTLPSLKAIFYTSTASEIIGTHLSALMHLLFTQLFLCSLFEGSIPRSSANPFTLWARENIGWGVCILVCSGGVCKGWRYHLPQPTVHLIS